MHAMGSARADLDDIRGNARDGIHAASAGGLWQALIFGFAGVKIREYGPTVNPHEEVSNGWHNVSQRRMTPEQRSAEYTIRETSCFTGGLRNKEVPF